jgi:hypothetical protein
MPTSEIPRLYAFVLIQSALVFLLSCNSPGDLDPASATMEYVIGEDAMTDILTDIQLIEVALVGKQQQGIQAFDISQVYYDSLFAKHNISKQMLDSSLVYYSLRPNVMEKIYAEVITRLSKRQSEAKSGDEEEEIN